MLRESLIENLGGVIQRDKQKIHLSDTQIQIISGRVIIV